MSSAPELSTRSRIGLLIYGMTNAVLFGIGLVLVLLIEPWSQRLWLAIPIVVVASLILAWPISWLIAPRLRKPLWRRRQLAQAGEPVGTPQERQDLKSGTRRQPSIRELRPDRGDDLVTVTIKELKMMKSLIVSIALAGLVFGGQMQSAEAAPSAPALSHGLAQSSVIQEAGWACGPRRCAWVPGYRGIVPNYALRWGPPHSPYCYWKRGLLGNWKYKCDDD